MSDAEFSETGNIININDLKKQRGSIKGRLTLFEKFVSKMQNVPLLSETQQAELRLRIESSSVLLNSFYKIQDEIEKAFDDTALEKQFEYREAFENQYFSVMSVAECLIGNNNSKVDNSRCSNAHFSKSAIKLPEIKLPTFDGSFDHWLEYKNSYLSMIHKRSDLDAIEKFHYLKNSLSGLALQVISELEFTAPNYKHAWELLEVRYQNSRLLIHNHIKSLFTAPPISKYSPMQVRNLIDLVLRNLRALKSLDEPTDSWDSLINYIIVSKLDSSTEREWENYIKTSIPNDPQKGKIKLDTLLTFLRSHADTLDMIQSNSPRTTSKEQDKTNTKTNKINSRVHKSHSFISTRNVGKDKSTRQCYVCGKDHLLYTCMHFLNLSVSDRIKVVNSNKLCFNCLRAGHPPSECRFGPCKQCQQKHNTLLHSDNYNIDLSAASAHDSRSAQKPVSVVSHVLNTDCANTVSNGSASAVPSQVLLSTALVEVLDSNKQYQTARVLLDSGSQNSFITEELCKRLDLSVIQSTMRISGVGQSVSQSNKLCDIHIKSIIFKGFHKKLRCYVLPNITSSIPSVYIDANVLRIPNGICLADPNYNIPSKIDILIGADIFWELLDEGTIRLSNGPYLRKSKVGWLISGPILSNTSHRNINSYSFVAQNEISSVDKQLRKFWELEEVGESDSILTKEERICEEQFVKTTKRDSSGRFLVRIPLKESANVLGDSYEMAKSRFLSLERKLHRSPTYKIMYNDFIREYIELGHMSRINEYTSPYYFLPHHGVLREHSTTTKLRVVFDASANTTSNKSFNDIQLIGPALQNDIFDILLRFRQYKYVACADVEKMYRQILVHPDQRNLQLILWRENPSDELCIYKLNTVTYGTASAPYLSIRCLRQLANETNDKDVARVITDDFFVDDLITGNDDAGALLQICEKVSAVLKSACFPLRKWTFNHDVNIASKELAIGDHCQNKTLGLGWQITSDELYFTTKIKQSSATTKRSIMSVISQIYDPLGLLSPIIVRAKIILQRLWLSKLDWDEAVPHDIALDWNKLITDLSNLNSIRVPRNVMGNCTQNRELHIFTDASQDAYGACAYIRTYNNDAYVTTNLLCAKSKVAPVKAVCTIPRLELCGALLGARLYNKIINCLRLSFTKVYFWTDSTIIMGWIKMSPHRLKQFVSNRVSQIHKLTNNSPWYHINGKDNSADILSRGTTIAELINNARWWHGPVMLEKITLSYSSEFSTDQHELPELKSEKPSVCMMSNNYVNLIDFNRFSSFNRLRRSLAYVLRFIYNMRSKKYQRKTGSLSVDELSASVVVLARFAQVQSFNSEYNDLLKQSVVKSKRILNLNVFLDDSKLIRVGGRLNNSPHFNYNKKHPVLLCSKHKFTELLFRHEHEQLLHGGPQVLLASIRETWWPLGGRNLARKIVHNCVKCTRIKGKTIQPIMGNLPAERLEPGFPFMRCGVDYAGPVMILNRRGRGSTLTKGYICLFICFCTHAVHLELVTSLTTSDYLLALKRFIARRGKPIEIISDNGKTFVGAEKEIVSTLMNNNNIIDFMSNINIKFSFIPPHAPHFGGLWESGVKSCKYHLRRVVGCTNLTYEEFITVLAQIEAVLNSRPLTALSTEPSDLLPLTPAHFLIGRPMTAPATNDLTSEPSHRLPRYDVIEQMRQHFWQRWAKEYVSELQTRTKWKMNRDGVQMNSLALIKEDNLPPLKWKLGRIIRIYPGTDGISRVADLRTSSGIIRRAFSKICPLPIPASETQV